MLLAIAKGCRRLLLPVCPKGTLRGHLWLALDRFLRTWENRGLGRALLSVWARRVRPVYQRCPHVPDNLFLSRSIRAHHHRIQPHTAPVDLIVCVHNALDDVKICLSSVVRFTRPPYRLILIDDGSEPDTRRYLEEWAPQQDACLFRHEQARGYTRAANAGLRASTAGQVVLLNSDTQVTPLWLDRLVACADSEGRIGLVGPLSNAASWQSVPDVLGADGDWMENALPDGCDLRTWALLVGRNAIPTYPRVPFLNGFCLLIKRAVIDQIGLFDEDHFGPGYGEENDYAVRARKAGWALALADDAYVWHRQSRSYSHERRKQLAANAQETLNALHGEATFTAGCGFYLSDLSILSLRARTRVLWERTECIRRGMERYEGRRILFVLPTARPGGGSHVIIQEARALQRMGVDVRLFNFSINKTEFQSAYPEITVPVLYGHGLDDLTRLLPRFDAVIATLFSSVKWIDSAHSHAPGTRRGYYIQDYEPWFFETHSADWDEAVASYSKIPNLVRLTKTEWNRRVVLEQTGQDSIVLGPSVDLEQFHPRPGARPPGALRIIAMIRPETARRNPERTLRVLQALHQRFGERIAITLFGCEPDAPLCKRLANSFPHTHLGIITRTELAALLPDTDLFLDFSAYQAMGLTALEAMACGTAVIVPRSGGAESFAQQGKNAWMVDTSSDAACLEATERLVNDPGLLQTLRSGAVADVCAYSPEKAALRILEALFEPGPDTQGETR
jgi:GT2 family glycosyltransferase/glycosyltransferase involved in cell wall biosynthesis